MPAEQMTMPASGPPELAIKIEEPEAKQSAAGDPWEPFADLLVECNSEPGDKDTKECGAEHVAGASQRRDADRFVAVPALRPRGYNKREPMRRDSCMKNATLNPVSAIRIVSFMMSAGSDNHSHDPGTWRGNILR